MAKMTKEKRAVTNFVLRAELVVVVEVVAQLVEVSAMSLGGRSGHVLVNVAVVWRSD